MKTLLALAVVTLTLTFAGCLAVTGTIGYTDPKTGATAGFTVGNAPSGKNVVKSKAGASLKAFQNDTKRVQLRK